MSNSEKNKRIAKNTFFLYIRMVVVILVNFYTMRVVLQYLGVSDFGLYNVVAGFVAMIAFLNQAMTNSIQRFMNFELGRGTSDSFKKYFQSALLTQFLIFIFVLLISESIGVWFLNTRMNIAEDRLFAANIVFQFSLFTLLCKIFESPFGAIIIAKEKMNFYAVVSLLEGFLKLFIAYSLTIVTNFKLEIYSFLLLFLALLILLSNVVYAKKIVPNLQIRARFYPQILKEMLSFSGWNLFGAASNVIQGQGINILMNLFFGVVVNAARGIAYQISGCLDQFVGNFQVAINPQIVQSYASKDFVRYKSLTFYSAKISISLIWMFVLPILFCANDVLLLWLGDNVPEYTVVFVKVILCISLINSLASSISVPIYATGKIRNYQFTVSLISISVLPISYVFYVLGYSPVFSMYIALVLAIVAQFVRVLIWSNLTNNKVIEYGKIIVFPSVCVLLLSYGISYYIVQFLPCFEYRFLRIISILFCTVPLNLVLMYCIMLNVSERKTVVNKLKKLLQR